MTKQEVVEAITLIVMSYPASFKDETAIQAMGEIWYRIFKDDNPRLVNIAIQKHITVSKWPPSIAEVREQMTSLQQPDLIPPDVAWAAVVDRLYADGRNVDDVYAVFPPLIARVLETIGWSTLYEMHRGQYGGYFNGQDKQTFMELYKPAYQREREKAMFPQGLKEDVEKTERILGGPAYKMLNEAHSQRVKQDEYYKSLFARSLADSDTPRLQEKTANGI